MNKEEKKAIQLLKSYAGMTHKLTDNQGRPKLDQAIERALNLMEIQYKIIEELEESKKIALHNYQVAISETIPKSAIRKKIEELNEKSYNGNYLYYEDVVDILKELLGGE